MRTTAKEQGNLLGVSMNSVHRWEHNKVTPRKVTTKKITDLFDIPLEWLLSDDILKITPDHVTVL